MISDRLATLFEPRSPRGYVGKHRTPKYLRYVAAAQVRSAPPVTEPVAQS